MRRSGSIVRIRCVFCRKSFTAPLGRKYCSTQCNNRISIEDRIKNNTLKTPKCFLWTGYTDPGGYPLLYIDGKKRLVTRYVWEQKYGQIPPTLVIRHRCNNPPCIRISHLRKGTQKDNMQDAVQSKRIASGLRHGTKTSPESIRIGEENPNARLTKLQVLWILRNKGKISERAMAKKLSVSRGAVNWITSGRGWRHLNHELA